ncbi:MAG: hypothetical protein NWQ54_09900, partial [Paraglaciecola sp.]|nr:hypothetical protein [Paraglaciecola sp.]
PALFDDTVGPKTLSRLLIAREFSRRPKNQNSSETLGLIKVNYQRLDQVKTTPDMWTSTTAINAEGALNSPHTHLNLEDWQNFLKVALDFVVRENTFLTMSRELQQWMGNKFMPKKLFAPNAVIEESTTIKRWPQIKKGSAHRLVKLLEIATGLSRQEDTAKQRINAWLDEAWKTLTVQLHILENLESGYQLK